MDKIKKLTGMKCDMPPAENYRIVPKSNDLVAELMTTAIYF